MAIDSGVKRLYKSRTERMIDGVCGGIAEYFGVDPTLVRIATVLLVLAGGAGVVLYIAGMILMPMNPFSPPRGT
jgi:phage shock protein C